IQIVCGAPNVAAGQKVVVGLLGATVPRNQHDAAAPPFVLSRVKLRGVESSGMICSEYELDLGKDADGIMVLGGNARVGQPFAKHFGLEDVVYDVEITPNRPDWLSHIGVAREIGAAVGKKIRLPRVRIKEGTHRASSMLKISVEDTTNCPRFAARVIRGVTIGPSPAWLQQALRNVGMRPRNNIVDVTNYVMLEYGQPLHAFDYELLRGGTIIVRQVKKPTPFRTLDGKEHQLPSGTVMVCDAEREVSIAGIMGGENSEIRDTTVDVVLESAYWNPSAIRRAAKKLGISTDASQRFERGGDPNIPVIALNRAAELIASVAGGEILKGVVDVYPKKIPPRRIPLRVDRVNAVLGTSLRRPEIVRILRILEIIPVGKKGSATVFEVPTFRVDVTREIDLIEEVARVYGYDRILEKKSATIDFSHPFPREKTADRVRDVLIGGGFQECITNSMQQQWKAKLARRAAVPILNPQNRDMECLRTSLVPGLLDTVARNKNFGNHDLRLFEIGHVFSLDATGRRVPVEGFLEEHKVCLVVTGLSTPTQWNSTPVPVSVFDLKGEVKRLLGLLGLDKSELISYSTTDGLTDQTLTIEIHNGYAGYLGRVTSEVLQAFGIEEQVFVAELDLAALEVTSGRSFRALGKFPKVVRDVALVVSRGTAVGDVEKAIWQASSPLLQSVTLFDVYEGENIPPGTRSLAFSLALQSPDKTLTDEEIDREVRRIVEAAGMSLGATLRSI
ncbi:MAG: phenylalanine--tRNA ligase subunit beta, partial [Ignavibacteria bacterium]|nr:phenylalanine--tRNA ligase subunit beta [Ignavibacteria bacterium]